jgi:ubiquinone/menaquinone biosynthesis C-methylase UbiE
MTEQPRHRPSVVPARSYDLVTDAYDRGRPSYPDDALSWLLHGVRRTGSAVDVLELGAGTGKLTEQLLARGCRVTATDPSESMLARLVRRAPGARVAAGTAEQVPVRPRSADVVVAAQAFDRFDAGRALPEVARVLRPGGQLAVIWSSRDERVPWVKRLGRLLGAPQRADGAAATIAESGMFEAVERDTFRCWQPTTQDSLRDLATSVPEVAVMPDSERARLLHEVDALYEEYGRGHDGMLLPYLTTVCRATVLPWALPEESPDRPEGPRNAPWDGAGGPVDDALLIDFR